MDIVGHDPDVGSKKLGFRSHVAFDISPASSRFGCLLFQNSVSQHFPEFVIQEKRKGNETQSCKHLFSIGASPEGRLYYLLMFISCITFFLI